MVAELQFQVCPIFLQRCPDPARFETTQSSASVGVIDVLVQALLVRARSPAKCTGSLHHDTITATSLLSESVSRPGTAIGSYAQTAFYSRSYRKRSNLTDKEIAFHLNLSARTIETHVALALERLNCRRRSGAVSRATSQGLLDLKD